MRRRRFICIRLSNPYMTCSSGMPFNRGRSPPQLLTEAAHGCLKSSPTRGLRRAHLHLSYSMTLTRLLDTTCRTTRRAGPHPAVRRIKRTARPSAEVRAGQSKHSAPRWPGRASGRCATGRGDSQRFAPPGLGPHPVGEVREIAFVPASMASTPQTGVGGVPTFQGVATPRVLDSPRSTRASRVGRS